MKTLAKPEIEVVQELAEARQQLEVAERELNALMEELVVGERANKQMVSLKITGALSAVRTARERLTAVLGL